MATIPDPNNIQRATPNGQIPVTSIDTGAPARAVASLGADVGNVVKIGTAIEQKRTDFQMQAARSQFLIGKTKLDNSLSGMEDYNAIVPTYQKNVSDLLGKVSQQISDPRARARFQEQAQIDIANGSAQATNIALGKEKAHKQATVLDQLNGLHDVVVAGGGVEATQTAKQLIDSATGTTPNDAFSPSEGVKLFNEWKTKSATSWLRTIPPEQRLKALKSPEASNIPADVRATLVREGEADLRVQKADNTVNDWMQQGLSQSDMLAKTMQIKDAKLRDETAQKVDYYTTQQRKAQLADQSQMFDKYYANIRSGHLMVSDIPQQDMQTIQQNPQMLNNLYAAQKAAHSPPVRSDPNAVAILTTEQRRGELTGDYSGLRQAYMHLSGHLNNKDNEKWMNASIEGGLPEPYKSLNVSQQLLRSRMREAGITTTGAEMTTQEDLLNAKLQDWYMNQWHQTGKLPNDQAVSQRIDDLLVESHSVPGSLFGTNTERFYQMDPATIKSTVARMKADNPQLFQRTLDQLGGDPAKIDVPTFIRQYEANAAQ